MDSKFMCEIQQKTKIDVVQNLAFLVMHQQYASFIVWWQVGAAKTIVVRRAILTLCDFSKGLNDLTQYLKQIRSRCNSKLLIASQNIKSVTWFISVCAGSWLIA